MPRNTRFTQGVTQANNWTTLGNMGQPDPFFYGTYDNDFIGMGYAGGGATLTTTGTSTITNPASLPGFIGMEQYVTSAAAKDYASAQVTPAAFYLTGKKVFFVSRHNMADITGSSIVVGLINLNTTPFAAITDGVWFSSPSGSSVIYLNSAIGNVVTTVALPNTFANGQIFDLGFEVNSRGDIYAYANAQGSGFVQQGGQAAYPLPRGPNQVISGALLTSVALCPTTAIQSGTATVKTLNQDYILAAQER